MNKSESIKELLTALAKAQGKISAAKKDSTNPHFKSKYADLAACWEAIKEPLSSNGLSLTQWVTTAEKGVSVVTVLGHSSGEFMSSEATFPVKDVGNPQSMGSSITYARRYCLSAAIGLVADDDDDGNAASPQKPAYVVPKRLMMTKEQYLELKDLAASLGFDEESLIKSDKLKRQPDDWDANTYLDIKARLLALKKKNEEVRA